MRRWVGVLMISLLLLGSGCSKPAVPSDSNPAGAPGKPTSTPNPVEPGTPPRGESQPAAPVTVVPRLLLDLPLGDAPDQPGSMPGRVGGISPRGPVAFAAQFGSIVLVDQAKGRVLRYADGKLAERISVPWLDEQWNDVHLNPLGMVLTVPGMEYTVELGGQIRDVRPLSPGEPAEIDSGKGPIPLGKDGAGNRFERAMGGRGPVAQRVGPGGAVQAIVNLGELGEIRDWYLGRDGALYAMTWQWGKERIERIKVYEIFPTVTFSSPGGGVDPAAPPVAFERPVPSRIRLRSPGWAPVEVSSEVDRWNLWQLLTTSTPDTGVPNGPSGLSATLEAEFSDGSTLTVTIRDDYLTVQETHYRMGAAGALRSLIDGLRLSGQGIRAALDAAQSVSILLADLSDVQLELNPAQRKQLQESLTGAMAVNFYAPPQPLEQPFPQYAIHLKGSGWGATLNLIGDRHLVNPAGGAAAHSGSTAALVKGWLPVPDLKPDQVGYLYLADKLELGAGNDLTRWKNTVVRRLIGARVEPKFQPAFREPFALTFWVKGEKRTVQVDTEGFTYAGKRYPGSGLTEIVFMQSVP